ncbi:MAG: hypothetical protein K2K16_08975 [Ruminococcus sp.]|nr:hypothetical protein [Ruminococcus sp.]
MKPKMTDKHKLMAYVLSTDEDLNKNKKITQKEIADVFGVGQSTISSGIKDAKNRIKIQSLENELSQLKKELLQLQEVEILQLPDDVNCEYKRML